MWNLRQVSGASDSEPAPISNDGAIEIVNDLIGLWWFNEPSENSIADLTTERFQGTLPDGDNRRILSRDNHTISQVTVQWSEPGLVVVEVRHSSTEATTETLAFFDLIEEGDDQWLVDRVVSR